MPPMEDYFFQDAAFALPNEQNPLEADLARQMPIASANNASGLTVDLLRQSSNTDSKPAESQRHGMATRSKRAAARLSLMRTASEQGTDTSGSQELVKAAVEPSQSKWPESLFIAYRRHIANDLTATTERRLRDAIAFDRRAQLGIRFE